MKRLFLFAGLFLFGFLSCEKNGENNLSDLPIWLKNKVELMGISSEACKLTNIIIAKYNGKNFYIIQSDISSCMYCDIYDESGIKPTWDENTWTDFRNNLKIIKTQTACDN
ncbi:MAG TPA: hypothetical protein PKO30_11080 [Prolixibacteraceae bacterium]|nr:hypothetical protein [Prolixibacteraceae bacterium]